VHRVVSSVISVRKRFLRPHLSPDVGPSTWIPAFAGMTSERRRYQLQMRKAPPAKAGIHDGSAWSYPLGSRLSLGMTYQLGFVQHDPTDGRLKSLELNEGMPEVFLLGAAGANDEDGGIGEPAE
jgi:hypothetical protein